MTEQEGVVKYHLEFASLNARHYKEFAELDAWRSLLCRLGLIGQDPERYEGLGFGNISFRLGSSEQFVITGSQTGGLVHLTDNHLSAVIQADPLKNRIHAEGPVRPSSEALTHAAIYQADTQANAVIHVHSPLIWERHRALALSTIPQEVPYGTPDMAQAVMSFCRHRDRSTTPLVVMLGHKDGVIAFSETITQSSLIVIKTLAEALQAKAVSND